MDALELSEVVRNYAIVIGGIIGIGVGAWRASSANRQAKAALSQAATASRDHITDVFGRAVGHLGDDRLEVRLGAIQTLRRIASDFPDFAPSVFALLSAYVRERSRELEKGDVPVDIRDIMEFLQTGIGERS
ncbi:MAG: hypothetical protein KIT00_12435 [Rhodospirillales bacterium]|nr:hypothetical protein [Rhodospirillales bacterium]